MTAYLRAHVLVLAAALVACAQSSPDAPADAGVDQSAATMQLDAATIPVIDAALDVDAAMGPPDVLATASGTIDLFVNGALVGKSSSPGALLGAVAALPAGENIVVLRATSGGAAQPFAEAELRGVFGRAGSSAQWKAKAAVGAEASAATGSWATLGFDDSAWANATDVQRAPVAPFPLDGPARGIWTASATDATVLLRLKLYVPAGWSADTAYGFGRQATGGAGGTVVTVTTPAELAQAVAGDTPTIIQISGTIDFTGLEGTITDVACVQAMQCTPPMQTEYILSYLGACNSKPTFSFVYDTAGTTPLHVGSNKTLIGLGPDATIKGKGLRLTDGASNIVIRNLTITGINPQMVWGGDALQIDNADTVWIDHVRFSLIARQMVVTGFGKASNVTISWSEFDGRTPYASFCNGSHYWVMLILGAADTITVSDNWIHDTSGRAPHAGGLMNATSSMQLVNDYYDHVPGFAANPITSYAKLLFEGTYFRDVDTPFMIDTSTAPAPGHAYAPIAFTLPLTTLACQSALGRPCVENIATPQNGFYPTDQAVLDAFSTVGSDAVLMPYPANEVPNAVPHLAGPGHI